MGDPGVDVMGKKSVLRTNFPFLMMWRTNEDMNKGLEQRDYESLNFLTNQRPGPPERKKLTWPRPVTSTPGLPTKTLALSLRELREQKCQNSNLR